ncbi:dihydrolipoyl dehydrogenase [Methylobacterium iners]|uniref:dihydrolipoyl dehydrogenase n=1 Tax=Methylobacterium iners TaxID=418707 RepID=UPI001EE19F53|nr:dihydrolipoyl dehydrogenase [Methylobacterium iners]
MRELRCDVAVIGAGTAGMAAYRAAREAGARAVLIEAGPGGSTCARVGCMPSKLLITAAKAAHDARRAGEFGVATGPIRVDGVATLQRVRRERDRFVAGVLSEFEKFPNEDRVNGRARFVARDILVLEDRDTRIAFGAAVIAAGSSPAVPELLAGLGDRVLTTDTLFEIPDLPRSLAVIGGGPVGIEIAQAMARLGVAVTLLDGGHALAGLRDPDLVARANALFAAEMTLHFGTKVERAESAGDGIRLTWAGKDGAGGSGVFDRVLAAAGRPPSLRGLGLEEAGLSLDEKGGPCFDPRTLMGEGAPIFVAGDAAASRPVLHEAARQGRIAGRNAAALVRSGPTGIATPAPWVNLAMVFTDPGTAAVGETYDPERAAERVVGAVDFSRQGRARIMDRAAGALRIYADRAGCLTGAEMLCPEAEHLGHLLAMAIQDGQTAQDLRDRPFYHPTVEEGLVTALTRIIDGLDAR